MPRYAACPSEARPVKPSRRSRLITRMEKASARVANKIMNDVVCGMTSATAARPTITIRIFTRSRAMSCPSEQPGRLHRQEQGHRRIEREVGDFGKQRPAEIVGEPDDQRADRGAAEAAHAADDHHGTGDRQHFEVETG